MLGGLTSETLWGIWAVWHNSGTSLSCGSFVPYYCNEEVAVVASCTNVIQNWLTSASRQELRDVCPRRLSIKHEANEAIRVFPRLGKNTRRRHVQPRTLASLLSSLTNLPMSSSSRFKSILDAALSEYRTKTGNDLINNSLAKEIQSCESAEAVLDIIQREAKVFDKFQDGDKRLMKWIGPSVDVLYTISPILSAGVSIVRTIPSRDDLSCDETSLCSRFLLLVRSLPESGFSSLFVHPFLFVSTF